MSALAGLAGFAEGFASARSSRNARTEREAAAKREDALIAAYGRNPGGAYPGGFIPGNSPGRPGEGLGVGPTASSGGAQGGLFGLIDRTEGGGAYDTLFGHSQNGGRFDDVDVSKMTIGELAEFSNPNGEYGQWVKGQVGRVATPMGRHQIVGTTLRGTSEAMGLSPDTVFGPQTQDSMANYLARQRLSGARSPAAKRAALRSEWEGFKHVSDSDLDAAIADFEANGSGMPVRPLGIGPV